MQPLGHASECDDGLRRSSMHHAWQPREVRADRIWARSHSGGMRISQAIHGESREVWRKGDLFQENIVRTGRIVRHAASSVHTLKLINVLGPNVWVIGTSEASRPCAIKTRPIRGTLFRGSNICQRPPR